MVIETGTRPEARSSAAGGVTAAIAVDVTGVMYMLVSAGGRLLTVVVAAVVRVGTGGGPIGMLLSLRVG